METVVGCSWLSFFSFFRKTDFEQRARKINNVYFLLSTPTPTPLRWRSINPPRFIIYHEKNKKKKEKIEGLWTYRLWKIRSFWLTPRPQDSGQVERSILNWIRLYIACFFCTTNSQIRWLPSLRSRPLEVTGARKNRARERDTQGETEQPLACRPRVLSCTHFLQASSVRVYGAVLS